MTISPTADIAEGDRTVGIVDGQDLEQSPSVPTGLYIDGAWCAATSARVFDVEDPATGRVIAQVADADPQDGARSLDAAARAQVEWARTPARDRADILRRAFDAVTERAEEFAALMTAEMGKPLDQAMGEVAYGAEFLRWFSEEATRVSGRYMDSPDAATRLLVRKQPVGPCLLITPWNFPLAMATRKIAPAVAAGCTMVLKPAALTPLTALLLTQVFAEAGLPAGVLNVVPTTRAGEVTGPLLRDPRLRKLSFTGSTPVGRRLLSDASHTVMRTSMELGGNAPFLVFQDADLDLAIRGAMTAKMRNMGEACTAANRFIVHADVAEEFGARLAGEMERLTVAPGAQAESDVGPLVDERSRAGVHELVQDAVNSGARLVTGGAPIEGPGYFYAPTVLQDVTSSSRIWREEIFGPVATITTFTTDEEAIAMANDTEYGLAAYAFTQDLSRALRLTERLEVGMTGINTGLMSNPAAPFGGLKQSGLGREGGFEGIEEYLETKYAALAVSR